MIGLMEDVRRVVQPGFKQEGDLIALLGTTADDLSISEYAATVAGVSTREMIDGGTTPRINLEVELAVQNTCLEAAEAGLLASAHDCSDGGLAVALAECCFSSLNRIAIGADINIPRSLLGSLTTTSLLYSESPSRIILSFPEASLAAVEQIAKSQNSTFTILGRVGGVHLRIKVDEAEAISATIESLEKVWSSSLAQKLEAEVMAAGME